MLKCIVFLSAISVCLSQEYTTLYINSSFILTDYTNPVTLNYQLRLQGNPNATRFVGLMTHQLSESITLGSGVIEQGNFTDKFILKMGPGRSIPIFLSFGNNQTDLWPNFNLFFDNFLPSAKSLNGTTMTIADCQTASSNELFCSQKTNTPLGQTGISTTSVAPPGPTIVYTGTGLTTTTSARTGVTSLNNSSTTLTSQTTGNTSHESTISSSLASTISTTPISSTTHSSPATTTLPLIPPDPTIINCTNPMSNLFKIYCNLNFNSEVPTAGNISSITNATLAAIDAPNMTPKEIYAVAVILEKCSLIKNLTAQDFNGMARLFDAILLAPEKSYESANDYSNSANSLVLTVNRMMTNSPNNVSYLEGDNIALRGKPLDCANSNNDAGGISDAGSSFSDNQNNEAEASISINGETVCAAKATRVFYTIYRNSKFFVGDTKRGNGIISAYRFSDNNFKISSSNLDATSSREVTEIPRTCDNGLLQTDGKVVSATALLPTPKGFKVIHRLENEADNNIMVTIKFNQDHIGVPLHGKLKISWWDHSVNQWSRQTCSIEKQSNSYVSRCTHLTDFTLLVDGKSIDPLYCNTALETINYMLTVGSMLGLFILCIIYSLMIIPFASNLKATKSLFKIIPVSDVSLISMIYNFLLLLFFFCFTIFTDQRRTTGYRGCVFVAILNYWLLMACVMLSLFSSWRIIKEHVKGTTLDKFFGSITLAKVIYPVTFVFATLLALIFGLITKGKFFFRNDSFCWVRPDFKWAIVIPFTILGISAIVCLVLMIIRRFEFFEKHFSSSTVQTLNQRKPEGVKTRLLVLFLIQFNLGAPWLLQYFTLFEPNATAWHFLFVIVNGSQGIIIFLSFVFRCYRESKVRQSKESDWRRPETDFDKERKGKAFNKHPEVAKVEYANGREGEARLGDNHIEVISRVSSHISESSTEISENILQHEPERNLIEDNYDKGRFRTSSSSNGFEQSEPVDEEHDCDSITVTLTPSNELSNIQNEFENKVQKMNDDNLNVGQDEEAKAIDEDPIEIMSRACEIADLQNESENKDIDNFRIEGNERDEIEPVIILSKSSDEISENKSLEFTVNYEENVRKMNDDNFKPSQDNIETNDDFFYPDNRISSDRESNSSENKPSPNQNFEAPEDASPISSSENGKHLDSFTFAHPHLQTHNSEGYLADTSDKDDSENSNSNFKPKNVLLKKASRNYSSSSGSSDHIPKEGYVPALTLAADIVLLEKSPELLEQKFESKHAEAFIPNNNQRLNETIESEEYFDAASHVSSNDLLPRHNPINSSDLDYVFHRVNGVVVRVHKDPNHPHYRPS